MKCLGSKTCDIVLNFKSFSETIDPIELTNLSNVIDKIPYMIETYYIFFPNLLTILIINVLQELFFIIVIISLPWILINGQIYYMLEGQKFHDTLFIKGIPLM